MPQLLKNNVSGTLANELSAVGTSMTLVDASAFPDPGADYYLCTLAGLDSNGREDKWEIVRVTAKASNTLSITRAQESTTNRLWPVGTAVQMRLTAGAVATKDDLAGRVATTGGTASGLTLNDGYTEEVFAVTGTTPALSPTNGSIQTWALSGNSTPTAGAWAEGQSITLMIDDGSACTITWTSLAVTWKTGGGTAPTLQPTGLTAIALWKVGSIIYGARVGDA